LILSFILSACGTGEANHGSGEKDPNSLSALLFEREDVVAVQIPLERSYSNPVSVVTNETERTEILNALYGTDISAFTEAELTGLFGTGAEFTVLTKKDERRLGLLADDTAQYLIITDAGGNQLCRKGPADSFDLSALDALVTGVLSNEADPDYSGTVTVLTTGESRAVSKGNCAYARSRLDRAVTQGAAAEPDTAVSYDIEFTVGNTTYEICSETGQIRRTEGKARSYARLEGFELMEVKTLLGI